MLQSTDRQLQGNILFQHPNNLNESKSRTTISNHNHPTFFKLYTEKPFSVQDELTATQISHITSDLSRDNTINAHRR